jgi:hypothetical protein
MELTFVSFDHRLHEGTGNRRPETGFDKREENHAVVFAVARAVFRCEGAADGVAQDVDSARDFGWVP